MNETNLDHTRGKGHITLKESKKIEDDKIDGGIS